MKKLLLPLLLVLLFFTAIAQNGEQIYYYYKGQKVFYPVSYDRLVVGIKPGHSFTEMKSAVAGLISVSADSLTKTFSGKQLLIKLGYNKVKDISPFISKLKQNASVLFARPVFKSKSGKYCSYGDEFIVNLKASTSYTAVQNLMQQTGCTLVRKYPFQDDMYILAAGQQANYDGLAMANLFYETGLFDYAEPNKIVYGALHVDPNDPLYNLQWAHKNTGSAAQYNGTPGADMKVQQAWAVSMGSSSIKIGVIDEGVDLTHPDLQANLLQGFNGATMTSNPGDGAPLGPHAAHGTNCAGIIAAIANNGIGVAGVAPNCKIIPAVIFDGDDQYLGDDAVVASFDYVRLAGADVISDSWGGGPESSSIDDAIHRAVTLGRGGKGCVVLFSSGNDNDVVSYPATNSEVIAVGGISMCNERKSPTSCDGENFWGANYGTGLDVVAPCVKIASTDIQGTGGYNSAAGTDGDYFNTFNGTSSACPNAAGVVALILSVNSSLTVAQATAILEASCDKIPGYTFAPNAAQPNGTWNNELGHGRVNALSAVQQALVCPRPTITAPTVTQPGCPGPVLGTIVVNATGSGTLEYSLNEGAFQPSNTFTGLTPGNYDISARIQGGDPDCIEFYSGNPVVINQAPSSIVFTAPAVTQPFCPNRLTGIIAVNASGSGALEFSLNGGPYQPSNIFNGLAPGNYNITARLQANHSCSQDYPGNPVVINPANTVVSTINYTGPVVAIPDANAAGVNLPITVSSLGSIADLNFRLNAASSGTCDGTIGNTNSSVDHTWVGDLVFKLTSPAGTVVTLINRAGGPGNSGNNFCTVTLDDQGGFPSIQTVPTGNIAGNFSPNSPLSAFNGQNPNGTWILNVSDLALADVGSVRRVSLVFTTAISCPPAPALYVDDDSNTGDVYTPGVTGNDATGDGSAASPYRTIAKALSVATPGTDIFVDAGTYNESVNINKFVTLKGAKADICASSRSGAETIINCVNGIGVNASNVTINGFTIQGQTSAAGPGFGYAVFMAPTSTGTQLVNNIIKNNVVGSTLSNAGASPFQVLISCNWFDSNNQPGAASGAGIYTDEFDAGGAVSNVLIDNNKFSGHEDAGIDFSTSDPSKALTGITISNNQFDANFRATVLFNTVSSTFRNNIVSNSSGTGSGEVRIFGGVNNFSILNNSFTNGAPAGIRITNDAGNSSNITVHENSFVGYTTAIQLVSGYTGPLDATCNWYGSTNPAVITPKISGNVTYVPFLTNGTDNEAGTPGFQPVPGSCNGALICESPAAQAYISNIQTGNQAHRGELGMEFIVNAPGGILIKQLGAFDDGANGITGLQPGGGVRVAIFNRTTHTIVPGLDVTIVGLADAYTGNHRMVNLVTPVNLPQGDYVIVAKGYHSGERNGNSFNGGALFPAGDNGGGAITFGDETSYGPDDPNGFSYPTSAGNFGNSHIFLAGTFDFTTVVPCGGSPVCESAAAQAYTSNTTTGNQGHRGELGLEFTVNNPGGIIVKQLGAFDDLGNGITGLQPGGGVRVAIFNRNTHVIVPGLDVTVIGNAGHYTGNHRLLDITPVTLPPGDYVIVAKGYNSTERNGNSFNGGGPYPVGDNGGGAITFGNEASYGPDDPNGFNYPGFTVNGDPHVFLAGTFNFTSVIPCGGVCESPPTQAYTSATQSGNQEYRGELGLQFTVNNASGIKVKQLGAFDDGGDGITGLQPGGGVRVAIFNRATGSLVPGLDATVIGLADHYTGNHRMKDITPITLPPGNYVLVAKGYHPLDPNDPNHTPRERNGNSFGTGVPYNGINNGGGAITFGTETSYGPDDPNGFNYPGSSVNNGDSHVFLAGTFDFTTNVPCITSPVGITTAMAKQPAISKPVLTLTSKDIKVYPNPTKGQFNVQLPDLSASKLTIQVMNSIGKMVEQKTISVTTKTPSLVIPFNLADQPSGIYLIKVESDNGTRTGRIVIER